MNHTVARMNKLNTLLGAIFQLYTMIEVDIEPAYSVVSLEWVR